MENTLSNIPITYLFISLGILILFSAFFSGSETGMMSINRYRLRHLAKTNLKARITSKLLAKPDKLLSVILICNNFVNISASAIATIIGAKLLGDLGILLSTIILTIILLIFGEITPKTYAASHPEQVAFGSSIPLKSLLFLLYPMVILTSMLSRIVLRTFGIRLKQAHHRKDELTLEELNTILTEATPMINIKHKEMLSNIINLNEMTVDDIMVPRLEVIGINLEDSEEEIINQLKSIQHTILPVYKGDINKVEGMLHMRDISSHIVSEDFKVSDIKDLMTEPYFVPEGTSLFKQLTHFQESKSRVALIVDEYGDVQGLITLADLLEEIVGEFTTNIAGLEKLIHPQKDGRQAP